MREAPVSGGEWSPPCVAVARLRRAVFSPPLDYGHVATVPLPSVSALTRSQRHRRQPARTSSGGRSATARAFAGGDLGAAGARVVGRRRSPGM